VDLYGRVRRACHVEGMSIREAARDFGRAGHESLLLTAGVEAPKHPSSA